MEYREASSTLMLPFELLGEATNSIRKGIQTSLTLTDHFRTLGLKVSDGNGVYCIDPYNIVFSQEKCNDIFLTLSIIAPYLYLGSVITFSGNDGLIRIRITSDGRAVREIAKWYEV